MLYVPYTALSLPYAMKLVFTRRLPLRANSEAFRGVRDAGFEPATSCV
jgi:hypothetical protein